MKVLPDLCVRKLKTLIGGKAPSLTVISPYKYETQVINYSKACHYDVFKLLISDHRGTNLIDTPIQWNFISGSII
jgi:hypothetical protein